MTEGVVELSAALYCTALDTKHQARRFWVILVMRAYGLVSHGFGEIVSKLRQATLCETVCEE